MRNPSSTKGGLSVKGDENTKDTNETQQLI